jgi:uncharacterized protein YndB with AHSA1/START domain
VRLLLQAERLLACGAVHEVVVTKRVAGPRKAVWSAYTDHLGWNEWAHIGKVRLEREGHPTRNGVGCIRVISSAGISAREEVLSFDEPERMTYRVLSGGLPIKNHLGEVLFAEEAAGATTITWRCRFESRIPGLGFLWRPIITKVFRDVLDGLAKGPFGAR